MVTITQSDGVILIQGHANYAEGGGGGGDPAFFDSITDVPLNGDNF